MRKLSLMVLTVIGGLLLGTQSPAQVTITYPAPPATRLEALDTNVNTLIIKATTEIGSVAGEGGSVTVRCRESSEAGSGRKEQGITLKITQGNQVSDTLLIDDDEIPSLLNALNQLLNLDFSITQFNALEGDYTTRGGCRIVGFALRRGGAFQYSIRDARVNAPPLLLSRDGLSRLGDVIDEAHKKLDLLRGK